MFRTWNDLVMVEDLERLGYPGLDGFGWDSSIPEDLIPPSGITGNAAHATAESGVALTPVLRRPAAGRRASRPHA
jgi:hypothetical protein